jgi:hypothetical protein
VDVPARARRAAASALLVASAFGIAATTAIPGVLAADPPRQMLRGMIVDERGAAMAGLHLAVTEQESADGGLAAFTATTTAAGIFTVDLFAWGTDAAPADVTVRTETHQQAKVVRSGCTRTYAATVSATRELALAGPFPPKPLDIVATTRLLGEVCGTKGTPAPNSGGSGSASGGSHTARPGVTPPATDALTARAGIGGERLGPALAIGFAAGLVGALMLLLGPARGARRRR